MGLFDSIFKKIKYKEADAAPNDKGAEYEFCPRCEANLTLQKGYSSTLSYWVCRGCKEMLISPDLESNMAWICDNCEAMLNIQEGFTEDCGAWKCLKCGHVNKIDKSEIYLSEDEFQSEYNSPYRGLSDEDMLTLSLYVEETALGGRDDVTLVRNMSDGRLYVRKILSIYDLSVYEYLKNHPIDHMPLIHELLKGDNSLIVIEEYIEGKTLLDILNTSGPDPGAAADITLKLCTILKTLHTLTPPIIHRDIKPSNVIISETGEIYLLDMNAAKWYKENETEDTRLLGTQYYAAPEQLGYGLAASSVKSDIYALGIMLNVMAAGDFPKNRRADEPLWSIVEKCISLTPDDRYSDDELTEALESIQR